MLDLFRSIDRNHLSGALSELFVKYVALLLSFPGFSPYLLHVDTVFICLLIHSNRYIDGVADTAGVMDLVVSVCTDEGVVHALPQPTPHLVSSILKLLQYVLLLPSPSPLFSFTKTGHSVMNTANRRSQNIRLSH